jgi:hypothetical protein
MNHPIKLTNIIKNPDQTDSQTDSQTESPTDSQTESPTDSQTESPTDSQTEQIFSSDKSIKLTGMAFNIITDKKLIRITLDLNVILDNYLELESKDIKINIDIDSKSWIKLAKELIKQRFN